MLLYRRKSPRHAHLLLCRALNESATPPPRSAGERKRASKSDHQRNERFAMEFFSAGRLLRKQSHTRAANATALKVQRTAAAFAREHGFERMRPGDVAMCMAGMAHHASSPSGRAAMKSVDESSEVLRRLGRRAADLSSSDGEESFPHLSNVATTIGATVDLRRKWRWLDSGLLDVLVQHAEELIRRGQFDIKSLAYTLNSLSSGHHHHDSAATSTSRRKPPPNLRSFLRTLSHAVVASASDSKSSSSSSNPNASRALLQRHGVSSVDANQKKKKKHVQTVSRAGGRDVALLWNALARLGFDDGPLLAALSASARGCAERNDFTPQGLGMVLNAVSKLGHRDDALMRALLLRVHERCDAMNSQSVALTLNALMRLRWEDAPLVARLSSLARDNIKKFSAKELVIVTNALSNLDYADRSDLGGSEVHVAALSSAIRRKAKLLDRHGVTLALEALAKLEWDDARTMRTLLDCARDQVHLFTPRDISCTFAALSRIHYFDAAPPADVDSDSAEGGASRSALFTAAPLPMPQHRAEAALRSMRALCAREHALIGGIMQRLPEHAPTMSLSQISFSLYQMSMLRLYDEPHARLAFETLVGELAPKYDVLCRAVVEGRHRGRAAAEVYRRLERWHRHGAGEGSETEGGDVGRASLLSDAMASQLHMVGLSLQLERPEWGLTLPDVAPGRGASEPELPSMAQSVQWGWRGQRANYTSSPMHTHVSSTLTSLGVEHANEWENAELSVDIAILHDETRVAVEIDGPSHFWTR